MKLLSARTHAILDYVTILFLAQSPVLFDFEGTAKAITYGITIVQLLLTIFTKYDFGIFKLIPFKIHGFVELLMSIIFVCISFYFYWQINDTAFYFYLSLACVYAIVLIFTNFEKPD